MCDPFVVSTRLLILKNAAHFACSHFWLNTLLDNNATGRFSTAAAHCRPARWQRRSSNIIVFVGKSEDADCFASD